MVILCAELFGKADMLVCETKHGTASRGWGWGGVSSWCPDSPKNAVTILADNFTVIICDCVQQPNSGGSQGGTVPSSKVQSCLTPANTSSDRSCLHFNWFLMLLEPVSY